jgi:hypothetical protein
MGKSDEFFGMLRELARQEGAVCIAPHQREFRRYERDFLDKLRHIPASITSPNGTNPYSMALGKPGKWLMVWIPDDTV